MSLDFLKSPVFMRVCAGCANGNEATASLDIENRERIVTLLFRMNKEFNTTIITVTHDLEIANRHDRVIHLERSK